MSCTSFPRRAVEVISALLLVLPIPIAAVAQQPTGQPPRARIKLERADQLPPHAYKIRTTALALFQSDTEFAELAQRLAADLRSDMATYDIQDRATLKSYYGTLGNLALQHRDYRMAVAWQDSIRAIEDKPGVRLSTGLVERAMAAATDSNGGDVDTARFRAALRREIAELPYPRVQAELAQMKTRFELMAPHIAVGVVQAQIEPAARSGSLSRELAQALVRLHVLVSRIVPVRTVLVDELRQTLAAHSVEKPDSEM